MSHHSPEPAAARDQRGIDPRGPRFGAAITSVLLLIAVVLGLTNLVVPAFILLAVIAALFAWGAFAGVQRHPYGLLFTVLLRPRLAAPNELEDPTPPTFAQAVGLVVVALGLALYLLGVPYALVVAAALAFVAAFLNSAFGFCIGCQLYLLLARIGWTRRRANA